MTLESPNLPAWLWIDEEPMQDFPEGRSQTAFVKGDHMR